MSARTLVAALFAVTTLLLAGAVHADDPPVKTLKDLKKKPIEIRRSGTGDPDTTRARDTYQRFLDLNSGDPQLRAEAMRRLGDLKLEAGEYARIEKDLAEGLPIETNDAIHLYSSLLATFPQYPRRDAVLYQLARAYEAGDKREQCLKTLSVLVADYPNSVYVDEAHFRAGEIEFSDKHWAAAQAQYDAVIQHGAKSEFYEHSLYKHGWSLFKQGEGEAANDSFGKLLDRLLLEPTSTDGMVDLKKLSRPQKELLDDTLLAIVLTESYADGPKSVDALVNRRGRRPYDWLIYSSLGDLYVSKERYTDAAEAYRAFVSREPNNFAAPGLEESAIEAYRKGGFATLVLDGKREFVERYRLKGPFWADRAPADAPEVVAHLKTHVQDLAAYYHEQAQRSKNPSDYQEAARWYREFLQSFPGDPAAPKTNYLLADTLFDNHQYRDAAAEYQRTSYEYAAHERSAEAGYAAIVAYDKEEGLLSGEAKASTHVLELDSSLKFATTYPSHPESVPVLVRCAREYYDGRNYMKAIEAANYVVTRDPPAQAAQRAIAWTVIANSRFDQGEYAPAEAAYLNVKGLLATNDPNRSAIEERLGASVYKQGEARQAAGDLPGAVDDYMRVSALVPDAKIRAQAEFDAATLLLRMRDWTRATGVLEGFRTRFPTSELQPQISAKLALAYTESGNDASAAAEYERISTTPGNSAEVQREALSQAASHYEAAGDGARAAAAWTSYVQRFPEPLAPVLEARLKLADIAGASGDAAARRKQLDAIVAADRAAGPARSDRSRYLAAKASLELATPIRDAFDAVKLVVPLKKSLAAKTAALQQALRAYTQANDYAVSEVSTAATFETAELYRRLGRDIIQSERPPGLSAEEREQYDTLLEEQAFPFEEKAIAIHEVNLGRASEGLVDVSVRSSLEALAKLNPGKYAKNEIGEEYAVGSPEDPQAASLADAVSLAKSRKIPDAQAAFQALADQDPASPIAPLDLGILNARRGSWSEAEIALLEAKKRDPRNAAVHAELAIVYRALGRLGEAGIEYQAAIEIDANNARAYRNRAILEDVYLKQPGPAVDDYQRALKLADNDDKLLAAWAADARNRAAEPVREGT